MRLFPHFLILLPVQLFDWDQSSAEYEGLSLLFFFLLFFKKLLRVE